MQSIKHFVSLMNTNITTHSPSFQYSGNQRLANISVIRPLLVVLLVFYHAFAIYGGSWEPIEGYPEIKIYWWLDLLSYACMLETFVFVSGYVFGYQVRTKGDIKLKAKSLFTGKLKRLILPCAIFSLLYIFLFGDITQPIVETLYSLVNGCAHMWFLPMLFWCFVMVWMIEIFKAPPKYVTPVLIVLSLFSVNGLPLQLSHTMYYMVFFYFGYALQRYNVNLDKYYTKHIAIVSIIVFAILFVALTLLKENRDLIFTSPSAIVQTSKFLVGKMCILGYSSAGIIMIMIIVGYIEKRHGLIVPRWMVEIGNLCFGVYLFQQFVLHALYYNTTLPQLISPYWLPWIGFILALIVSLVLSWLLRLTQFGKALV